MPAKNPNNKNNKLTKRITTMQEPDYKSDSRINSRHPPTKTHRVPRPYPSSTTSASVAPRVLSPSPRYGSYLLPSPLPFVHENVVPQWYSDDVSRRRRDPHSPPGYDV